MAIITFVSDFGRADHYVASVKARMLSINPGLQIVDISHDIEPFNLAHAAFVIKSVFRDFPKGTVHLISVNAHAESNNRSLTAQIDGHNFIGPDNGILGLISEKEPSMTAALFDGNEEHSTFPTKNVMAKAAAMLASGSAVTDVGAYSKDYVRRIDRKFRATKKQISGNIIRVDHYGNLISNIEEEVFDILRKERKFTVQFGRESIPMVNKNYNELDDGECFVVFNDLGLLEIGINKGNASELLGLKYDSPVSILFEDA